ncbi:MAG: alkaline phosphatase D family protein [Pirellulaceae bacterium]
MRRSFPLFVLTLSCALALSACAPNADNPADDDTPAASNDSQANPVGEDAADSSPAHEISPGTLTAGQGIMVGGVDVDRALVQVRLTKTDKLVDGDVPGAAGVVEFSLHPEGKDDGMKQQVEAVAEHDFIARASFSGLEPNTRYVCETRLGSDADSLVEGPTATFSTLAGAEIAKPAKFVVVTGMNYAKFHGDNRIDRAIHVKNNNTELPDPYAGADKELGYPALKSILDLRPDFFVGTGDNVYYDTPKEPRAETIAEMRQKWHEQFVQPRYRDLFAKTPTYWEVDDHDFRYDDCDNTTDAKPSPELGQRVMLEQLPYAPMDAENPKTYRTHRVSKDLQIWLVENRIYRSPNETEDGPEKTIWGAEQKAWLKRTLAESDATFKVLVSPTPMIGPDDLRKIDNHCDVGGFQHERDEFFAFLADNGLDRGNFALVCGDRHWQYHAVFPGGIEEFSSGALVDANSRPGRAAGDPKSTDAEGLIKQPYLQDPPSGGFLMVSVAPAEGDQPAKLTFEHFDEQGVSLNKHEKTPPGE